MTITIRPAIPQDVDTIHRLGEHVEEFKTSKETVTFWPKHILKAAISSDEAIVLVAEQDGRTNMSSKRSSNGNERRLKTIKSLERRWWMRPSR